MRDGSLASSGESGIISIWDVNTGEVLKSLKDHQTTWIPCLKELSDDSLASGSHDKSIKIWNPHSGQLLLTLEGHTDIVKALDQLSEVMGGGHLVSGSLDRTIKIWNLRTGELLRTFQMDGLSAKVHHIRLLNDENLVILSNKLMVLNLNTGNQEKVIRYGVTETTETSC